MPFTAKRDLINSRRIEDGLMIMSQPAVTESWPQYADHALAPKCRSRTGSNMPVGDPS
jgi:hypothetical protein